MATNNRMLSPMLVCATACDRALLSYSWPTAIDWTIKMPEILCLQLAIQMEERFVFASDCQQWAATADLSLPEVM